MQTSGQNEPTVSVSGYTDEDNLIAAYLVWVYPHDRIPMGARVVYFRSIPDKRLLCYIHHEATGAEVTLPDDELYLCEVATQALYHQKQITFTEDYDVFSDFGGW